MADQSYLDRWAYAAWHDLEFYTDSHDAKGGRRLAVHEFPGAEAPLVEDLGGKTWDYQLNAYFVGPNYDLEADMLIAELNTVGADWLMHPWLGLIWVRPQSWSRHESSAENGLCTLSITWVPGGEQPPTPSRDLVDTADAEIEVFADEAEADFDMQPMSADGMTAFVAAVQSKLEYVRQAISFATLPLTWANQLMNLIAGVKGDLAALAAIPGSYANAWRSLSNAIGMGADQHGFSDIDRPRLISSLCALALTSGYQSSGVASIRLATSHDVLLTGIAATDSAVRANLQRDAELRSRLLLAAACKVALADYRSANDRDAVVNAVETVFDALLPALSDAVFQAAVTARAALIEALMSQDLKPQMIRDVVTALPSTVLAHRMQIDEDVFLARNAVRHPLFVRGRVYG